MTPPDIEEWSFFNIGSNPVLYVYEKVIDEYKNSLWGEIFPEILKLEEDEAGIADINDSLNEISFEIKNGTIIMNGLNENDKIEIFDLSGREILSTSDSVISGLPNGFYILRIGNYSIKISI